VFEVTVGDDLVFSKKATGRFPEPGEVVNALRDR
jgi:selT/selW/selH-like putative selenoprotein